MGEPAFQLPEDDQPDIQPENVRPNLRALEGGGTTTPRASGHLSPLDGGDEEDDEAAAESGGAPQLHGLEGGGETSPRAGGHLRTAGDVDKGDDSKAGSSDPETSKPGKHRGEKKGVRARARGITSSIAKHKWLWGLGSGAAGIAGFVILLLVLLAALKIPHLAENITAYQFARVFQQSADENDRVTAQKIAIDSADDTLYGKFKAKYNAANEAVSKKWALLDDYRPNKVIQNMATQDQLKFNYSSTVTGRQKLASITMNGVTSDVESTSFAKKLIPGYKFISNVKLASQFQPTLSDALRANTIGPITRGLVAKEIRQRLGISLIAWVVAKFNNDTPAQAATDEAVAAEEKINTPSNQEPTTEVLKNTTEDAEAAEAETVSNPKAVSEALASGGSEDSVAKTIVNGTKGSTFDTALGFANPAYAIAMPACIIYDGSLVKAGPTIDSNSAANIKEYYYIRSASDQQKDGTNASEKAVGALSNRLGDDSTSVPLERATGMENYTTTGSPGPQTSASGAYTLLDVLLGNSALAGAINSTADTLCPALTSTKLAIGVAAVNAIFAVFTLGSSEGGEEGVIQTLKVGVGKLTSKIGDALTTKIAAKEATGKLYGILKDAVFTGGKIAGATVLARLVVASDSGYLNNGLDTGNDTAEHADAGGNLMANEVEREQFYGRPLDANETSQAVKTSAIYVSDQNKSKSAYQRYFAISNPFSFASLLGTSISGGMHNFSVSSLLSNVGSTLFRPIALAAGGRSIALAESSPADMTYGNIQWGWSANEIALSEQPTYSMLENQHVLDESGQEDAISAAYGQCFDPATTQGTLISGGDIVRDNSGNVQDDQGNCSPDNLTVGNRQYCYTNQGSADGGCDLVFRWRLAMKDDSGLNTMQDEQNLTATEAVQTTGGGSKFKIASYNSLGSGKKNDAQYGTTASRSANEVAAMTSRNVDIFGMQELEPDQFKAITSDLGSGWASFPASYISTKSESQRTIFWNTARFGTKPLNSGTLDVPWYGGTSNTVRNGAMPWIRLQDVSTGQQFIVLNEHPVAWNRSQFNANGTFYDKGGAIWREITANLTVQLVTQLTSDGTPVMLTGDMNSTFDLRLHANGNGIVKDVALNGDRNRLPYCILTAGNVLQDTYDMFNGKSGHCPSHDPEGGGIDHVYATPKNVTVTSWNQPRVPNASDHNPVIAGITIAGSGASATDASDITSGTSKMVDDYGNACYKGQGPTYGVSCDGQCVDFVEYRLKKNINPNKFSGLGNGDDVVANLGAIYGYATNHNPKVHDVVSWPAGGVPGAGGEANDHFGHTAIVAQVNNDGSIVVEEYNYLVETPKPGYDTRKIPASTAKELNYAQTGADYGNAI